MWKFILHIFYGGMSCGYREEEISLEDARLLVAQGKAVPYDDPSIFGKNYITVRQEISFAQYILKEGFSI